MTADLLHYHTASTTPEQWLIVHVRRLFVHTFHNQTICLSADGRIAVAVGPFLLILHPPPVPPFRPTLNPPLRLIFSIQPNHAKPPVAARKDTLITSSHLTAVSWTHHCLLLLTGYASLTFLKPPPHAPNFAQISSSEQSPHSWIPDNFSLPKQFLKSPLTEKKPEKSFGVDPLPDLEKIECYVYTRLCVVNEFQVDTVAFFPFLVYGNHDAAQIIPVRSKHSLLPHSTNLIMAPFRIHNVSTTAVSCVEGVSSNSEMVTAVAVADASLCIVVYTLKLSFDMEGPFISSQKVWSSLDSLPPGPVVSFSWSLPGTRNSLLTLAVGKGNDVVILDWVSQLADSISTELWSRPQIHFIDDAHDHIITGVQICQDGSVVSSAMDGRIICWRINPVQTESINSSVECGIIANVLQECADAKEPVMALERTANAFAFAALASVSRHGQEVCDTEVTRKSSGQHRRTILRICAIPPYGTPENVESTIMSCVERLINHPSCLDQPLTFWDVSHFLHSFHECATAVVPRLRQRLVEMVESHEKGNEKSTQKFIQRSRVLLWLARIIDHPDGIIVDHESHDVVKDLSRRLRNSLLFVQFVNSLHQFLAIASDLSGRSHLERLALENMCQFVSTWRVLGVDVLETGLQAVREVRKWMQPFIEEGESLSCNCSICSSHGSETLLVVDGVDPSSVWCIAGHSFPRCVVSALPVVEAVSMECAACGARAYSLPEDGFNWLAQRGHCALCNGGIVSSQCEAG